jgi:hypothetical protein
MASGPYGLLLSNVDVGYGSRFWGPQVLTTTDVASFMTAWNVKSQVKVRNFGSCCVNCYVLSAVVADFGVYKCS